MEEAGSQEIHLAGLRPVTDPQFGPSRPLGTQPCRRSAAGRSEPGRRHGCPLDTHPTPGAPVPHGDGARDITASVDQDTGGITTYSMAGAQYGYAHLWSLPFIILALAVVQEMGTRMGVVTGRGLADLIRERFGVRFTLLAMTVLVLANIANTASNFAGVLIDIGAGTSFFAIPFARKSPAIMIYACDLQDEMRMAGSAYSR